MTSIAIIGAGISGLHLALRLQEAGMDTTLYSERTPDQIAAGRPANLVARFEHTRARERALGVAHWESPDHGMFTVRLEVAGDLPLGFTGHLHRPASNVDFRVYLPQLLADYTERAGQVVVGVPDISATSLRHDLVVVASGARTATTLFPRDPARSPYGAPQRMLCAGFFRGIAATEPMGLHFQLCPGAGEIFVNPFLSITGQAHALMIEAVPGGSLEPLTHRDHAADPRGFDRAVLDVLTRFAPAVRDRVDDREFGLTRPIDLLQGAITPTVRRGWAELDTGRCAIAIGDAWVLNDPIVGQGANLGSHSAFVLADMILAGPPYDSGFCRAAEARMWEFARPVTEWSNAFLQPPPPHAVELLAAAAQHPRVADAFVDNFNDPPAMWHVLSSPEHTSAWLDDVRAVANCAARGHHPCGSPSAWRSPTARRPEDPLTPPPARAAM